MPDFRTARPRSESGTFVRRPAIERIMEKVLVIEREPDLGPCWEWQGATRGVAPRLYGVVADDQGRQRGAHRVAYELLVGPIPEDEPQLDHVCRNTLCVNPAHLDPVTNEENSWRGDNSALARQGFACGRGHARSERHVSPSGKISCRACDRDRKRRARSAQRR